MLRLFQLQSFCAICTFCLLVSGCSEQPSSLAEIKQKGEIRFAVRTGPASYYVDKDGENGLEFELATQFAEYLGVKLSLIVANNNAQTRQLVKNGEADIAAGSIAQINQPESLLLYGPGYQWVTRQIIYRTSYWRPSSLSDIHPDELHAVAGTVPPPVLNKLKTEEPSVSWKIHDDKENLDLLALVENGEILYAVAYSNDVILARESYPEIRPAFNLTEPEPLSWAIRNSEDKSLLEKIDEFHQQIADSGELADLIERFYGPTGFFDYVDSRKFVDKYRKNLPALKAYFKRSAYEHDIDWRLLAALSYQESHWNKNARSHTGVRGLMMLTRSTARQVGVKNRLDPKESIDGGAKYLKSLTARIPERITEPDRTWLALAAYNVGFGHLEDARILTERDGGNPDLWEDVKQRLPLLSKSKWYKQTKYGYARGNEPVKFVRKVRKYYNVLVNLTQEETIPRAQLAESVTINSPVL